MFIIAYVPAPSVFKPKFDRLVKPFANSTIAHTVFNA